MLCPEVWNFNPPSSSSSTKLCESESDIFRQINYQYFNHYVSVTLPNTIKPPIDIINVFLEDSQYYRIDKVPAAEFVKKDFLDFFANNGQLTAKSLNECSEENSFVITPCGKLILSLTKSTYLELGIESSFTKHPKSSLRKYFIVLELTSSESRKKLEKIGKKLANLQFDVVLSWEPESKYGVESFLQIVIRADSKVCPSSIAYYFTKKNYAVKTCDILYKHEIKYNAEVPIMDDECDISDFIEWLGAFSLDCELSDNNQLSSLRCPEKNEKLGQVMHLTFSGLITHSRLKRIISEINNYVKEKCPIMWISLIVQGFHDSVISVQEKNLFLSEGDQNFVVIFKLNHPYVVAVKISGGGAEADIFVIGEAKAGAKKQLKRKRFFSYDF